VGRKSLSNGLIRGGAWQKTGTLILTEERHQSEMVLGKRGKTKGRGGEGKKTWKGVEDPSLKAGGKKNPVP